MKLTKNVFNLFSVSLGLMSLVSCYYFMYLLNSNRSYLVEWEIYTSDSVSFSMSFIFDWMSLFFLSVVSFVSSVVMSYSKYYMFKDKHYFRFGLTLSIFILSMMLLILSPNMISLLLGWDGLGLSSYILVIFYQSDKSNCAGMITVLSNRIGDTSLLMSICFFFEGSWNFIYFSNDSYLGGFFLMVSAMTKSAQLPFSAWLPAAMAAPTPVSALVHSSTLVTAGVYLLIRFYFILSSYLVNMLLITAVLTVFMSGMSASCETDLKKIIALSTLSQLGFMMLILSMGFPTLCFFHLLTHALFKSTLFMSAGLIIHMEWGTQNSQEMGNLGMASPMLSSSFTLMNMALCGFPFLAGFYSKDLILESMFKLKSGFLILVLTMVGISLTVFYSLRIMYICTSNYSSQLIVSSGGGSSKKMIITISSLFISTVLMGFMTSWWIKSYSNQMLILMKYEKFYGLTVVLLLSILLSLIFSQRFNFYKLKRNNLKLIYLFVSQMWLLVQLSGNKVLNSGLKISGLNYKFMDKGWFEFYGGKGVQIKSFLWSASLQSSQNSILLSSYFIGLVMFYIVVLFNL